MSYNVSALSDYAKQNMDQLIAKAILEAKTVKTFPVVTGVKYQELLPTMETGVTFQADGCGRTPSDETKFSNVTITVGAVMVAEDLCTKDLTKKFLAHKMGAGSYDQSIPFEQQYLEEKSAMIMAANDVALWQGDSELSSGNNQFYDGFIKQVDAGSPIDGNTGSVTSITSTLR